MNSDQLIEFWCDALSKRVVEIRFIDMDEMRATLKVHFKSALYDCLKIQISETEQRLIEIKKRYAAACATGGSNQHIHKEIIELKAQKKRNNMLYAELDRENEAKEFNLWMKGNGYENILTEFYSYYNEKHPNHTVLRKINQP